MDKVIVYFLYLNKFLKLNNFHNQKAFHNFFYPKKYYPDYMEIQKWIMDNIDGSTMNIEDVCYKIANMMVTEFEPSCCIVTNHVHNCKTHFDVDVTCNICNFEQEGE